MTDANFRRSLLVCCDLRRYSAADDQLQRALQELLVQSLDRAAAAAGIDRTTWQRQPEGDGEFAVLPSETPEHLVVDRYVRSLHAELQSVNRYRVAEAKVRMRLAIHHGVISEGANGFPGKDTVLVARLLSSRAAHVALDRLPSADLVVILSEHLYDTLVATGHTTLRADDFRRVEVKEKTFDGHGWLWVPDAEVHSIDLDPPAEPGSASASPFGPVTQHAIATGGSTIVQAGRDAHIPRK